MYANYWARLLQIHQCFARNTDNWKWKMQLTIFGQHHCQSRPCSNFCAQLRNWTQHDLIINWTAQNDHDFDSSPDKFWSIAGGCFCSQKVETNCNGAVNSRIIWPMAFFYFTLSSFSKTLDSREFSIIWDAFHQPANNISGWRIGFGILISTDSNICTVWNSKYILTDIFKKKL